MLFCYCRGLLSKCCQNIQGNRDDIEDLIRVLDRIRLSITEPLRENALQNRGTVTQSLSDQVDSLTGSELHCRSYLPQRLMDNCTRSIDRITSKCNKHLSQGRIRRFFHNIDDANVIKAMNWELDRAIQTYLVISTS